MLRPVFIALALFTAAPIAAHAQASGPPHVEHEADYIKAVIAYVRNSRGWPDSSYTVSFYGKDGDTLIFAVDYARGDTSSYIVGNEGGSFKVAVNPKTKKIEREMYFG